MIERLTGSLRRQVDNRLIEKTTQMKNPHEYVDPNNNYITGLYRRAGMGK